MENNNAIFERLRALAVEAGAHRAAVIDTRRIETERSFRDLCASNACGLYGRCHMCPPDIGDIDLLMDELYGYERALVYQTVSDIEDSFDFEGMMDAKKRSVSLALKIRGVFADERIETALHLGAGGCGVCGTCAKVTDEPCRHPGLAMASLEAYGVNVTRLAEAAGMKYINGANTVTYFGVVLFSLKGEGQE